MKSRKRYILNCLLAVMVIASAAGYSLAQSTAGISATITSDHETAYVHETFNITITIVSDGVRLGKNLSLGQLSRNTALNLIGEFKEIPLKRIQSREIRQFRCEARVNAPGTVKLDPTLEAGILHRRRSFIGNQWVQEMTRVAVNPFAVKIISVPDAAKPADYSGAVGEYSFEVSVSPTNISVGDLVTATSKISGKGYLDKLSPPRFSPGSNFKVYDPELVEGSTPRSMAFEQVLIPQTTNAVSVPEISFCYFDPARKTFKTITHGPFPLAFRPHKTTDVKPYRPPARPDEKIETPENSETQITSAPSRKSTLFDRMKSAFRSYPLARLKNDEKVRFAPAQSSVSTFTLSSGTTVEVLELYGNWARIDFENKRGWIPAGVLEIEEKGKKG